MIHGARLKCEKAYESLIGRYFFGSQNRSNVTLHDLKLTTNISSVLTARAVLLIYACVLGGQFYTHERIHHQNLALSSKIDVQKSNCCSNPHLDLTHAQHAHVDECEHFCKFCDKIFNPTLFKESLYKLSAVQPSIGIEVVGLLTFETKKGFKLFRNKSPPVLIG